MAGDNLLGLWTRVVSPTPGFTLQLYYARSERSSAQLVERRDIADIDVQHHLALGTRQNLVWGLGYRFTNDQLTNGQTLRFTPQNRRLNLWSGFLQDEIALLPKAVPLSLDTKVEHNDLTGVVIQPNGRLRWTPTEYQTLVASVSQAIRAPSRVEDDGRVNSIARPPSAATGGLPVQFRAVLVLFFRTVQDTLPSFGELDPHGDLRNRRHPRLPRSF